ncbi:uncharacterized protein LOC129065927 isoform X2 [Pteronotus mesoamericanus]|uniref:uncharacterized protein LOC129065927 isoform X2 n=1 Tax=Pteronotus mesoamericanus TaxID=1884717 RepID=UPI0023EC8857|nr:uncharacterized protein LOC129065927 isoform X2 [Pteronotus parnellii mesoamericanus]
MFSHAVTRALRKNKTLRYGVPMLIDPELEKKLKMNKVSLESEYEFSLPGPPESCLQEDSALFLPRREKTREAGVGNLAEEERQGKLNAYSLGPTCLRSPSHFGPYLQSCFLHVDTMWWE